MPATRRQVLQALGAALGGGAVVSTLAALDLVPDDRAAPFRAPARGDLSVAGAQRLRVLVLGAGMAGLCCAYELEKAGHAVTVVEARAEVGGRNRTVRAGTASTDTRGQVQRAAFDGDLWFDPGPARIASHHTTLAYCRELGVPVEVFVNASADAFVERDGVVRRRRQVQADLDGYVAEVLEKAVGTRALDAGLSPQERDGLVDHLRTVAGGPSRRGPAPAPRDPLALLLGLQLGDRVALEQDWHQAMPMFHPVGGMDALPRRLREELHGDVQLGTEVLALQDDGVEVAALVRTAGREVRRLRADVGIAALPPHLLARLPHPFPTEVGVALGRPAPVVTGKVGLEYGRRFWETDDGVFGGATVTGRAAGQIWYPSSGWLGHGGVVVGAYPFGPAAEELSARTHAGRVELALEAGEAVHGPVYRQELRSAFSVDWRTQPFAEGAWAQWDRLDASWELLQRPAGRWWFAGDWTSRASGWQHGALESARAVVAQVHQRALSTR